MVVGNVEVYEGEGGGVVEEKRVSKSGVDVNCPLFLFDVGKYLYLCGKIQIKQKNDMPVISSFLGIIITMYFNEHNPPHFHAKYNEFRAEILIDSLAVKEGKLPPRILGLVTEWAELHKDELMENWKSIRETGNYKQIQPLIIGGKSDDLGN